MMKEISGKNQSRWNKNKNHVLCSVCKDKIISLPKEVDMKIMAKLGICNWCVKEFKEIKLMNEMDEKFIKLEKMGIAKKVDGYKWTMTEAGHFFILGYVEGMGARNDRY